MWMICMFFLRDEQLDKPRFSPIRFIRYQGYWKMICTGNIYVSLVKNALKSVNHFRFETSREVDIHCFVLFCFAFCYWWANVPTVTTPLSMAWCKTAVTPVLTHWSYSSLALSHEYVSVIVQHVESDRAVISRDRRPQWSDGIGSSNRLHCKWAYTIPRSRGKSQN